MEAVADAAAVTGAPAAGDDVDNDVVGSQFSVKLLLPFCSSDGEMRMGLWLDITTFFCRLLLRTGIFVVSFRRMRSKRDDVSDMQSSLCWIKSLVFEKFLKIDVVVLDTITGRRICLVGRMLEARDREGRIQDF